MANEIALTDEQATAIAEILVQYALKAGLN